MIDMWPASIAKPLGQLLSAYKKVDASDCSLNLLEMARGLSHKSAPKKAGLAQAPQHHRGSARRAARYAQAAPEAL